MSSLNEVVQALKATGKTIEDTGFFVADYTVDEIKKTTDTLKGVDGAVPVAVDGAEKAEPVEINTAAFTTLGKQICDAIIFQTEYLDNTLQKIGASITASIEKVAISQASANKDNSGREIPPLTPAGVEEATVEANKSFFGADFGKSFLGFAEKVSSGAGKVVGKVKDVAIKPITTIFDKLKEVFSRMAEIFLAVGFVKFMQGWEKASKFFGDNATFGEKLSTGIANIIGTFTGMTEGEIESLAKTFASIWKFISDTIKSVVDTIGIIPTIIGGLLLYFMGPSGIIAVVTTLGGIIGTIGSFIGGTLLPALTPVLVVAGIIATAAGLLYTVIKGVIDGFDAAKATFNETGSLWEALKSFVNGYFESITSTFKGFFTSIWDGMKSAISKTIEWINSNVIKYLPKVPYIKDPFAGGGGGSTAPGATEAAPAAAVPATPTRAPGVTEAAKVAEQSKTNAVAKETATAPASTASNNSVVTQVNNNANNKTVYGMKFETKPGIGNSSWAISHAMP